ncbi:MAG: hypothetical protein E4G98_02665 [Promethearchaeota archaeon]|nr:MAG: hypothetical protein E4G98_02665 [Candidatus Lokiarchaeota archaeon]
MEHISDLIDKLRNNSDFHTKSPHFKQNVFAFLKLLTVLGVSRNSSPHSDLSSASFSYISYSKIDSEFSSLIINLGGKYSQFPLLNSSCCESAKDASHYDMWKTVAYEFLLEYDYLTIFSHLYQFFLENQHATGSFYTPLWLVQFHLENLQQILDRNNEAANALEITQIADLSCGTGNFLLCLVPYYPNSELTGYDLDPLALELCGLNFLILSQANTSSSPSSVAKFPTYHLGLKDSLKHLLPESGFDLLVGNPPWGLDLKPYKNIIDLHYAPLLRKNSKFLPNIQSEHKMNSPKSTYSIRDQLDSFALFLYRHLQACRPHGIISLILPDTLLFNPVYEPLRKILLERTKILQILYLGEAIFTNVTHPALILTIQNTKPSEAHQIEIVITAPPPGYTSSPSELPIQITNRYSIVQKSFTRNVFSNFTIFQLQEDAGIIEKMNAIPHFHFGDFVSNSRGVELGKNGEIYQCPYCSLWNPKPQFKIHQGQNLSGQTEKSGKSGKTAKCNHCHELITDSQISGYRKIIHTVADFPAKWVLNAPKMPVYPILVGESISQFQYLSNHVIQLGFQGIKYKLPSQYIPPKILFRKTGRGFFAAIDYDSHYLVQVIYQFTLKPWNLSDSNPKSNIVAKEAKQRLLPFQKTSIPHDSNILSRYSLEFLFGVVSSKLLEYYYFRLFSNPKKKAFPHLLQANLLALPIPSIDFDDPQSESLASYYVITSLVKSLHFQKSENIPDEPWTDATIDHSTENQHLLQAINLEVMHLFSLSPEECTVITTSTL